MKIFEISKKTIESKELQEFLEQTIQDEQNITTNAPYFIFTRIPQGPPEGNEISMGYKITNFCLIPAGEFPRSLTDPQFLSQAHELLGCDSSEFYSTLTGYQNYEDKIITPIQMITPAQQPLREKKTPYTGNLVSTIIVDSPDLMYGDALLVSRVTDEGEVLPFYGSDVFRKLVDLCYRRTQEAVKATVTAMMRDWLEEN